MSRGSSISNSYATGGVSSSSSYSHSGGLVAGLLSGSSIENSYATGAVSASNSGGLVARMSNSSSISGNNYYVDRDGTNGIGDGSCDGTVCERKSKPWLQNNLDEASSSYFSVLGVAIIGCV